MTIIRQNLEPTIHYPLSTTHYMQRCLSLASLGLGHTDSNPLVGCVIVKDGKIIGEGYHHRFGGPHAEVNAVDSVEDKELLRGATVYVNLEPCAHFGKTPPCCDLLIAHGIKEIYIAQRDPFPKVDGEGIRRMKEAGIGVHVGLLQNEAELLNKRFLTFHAQKRPYISLKWMQSRDGFIGRRTGERLILSNPLSQQLVHKWRSEEQVILVGPDTALLDDPSLDNRYFPGKSPLRILIDRNLRVPHSLKIFSDGKPLWVLNTKEEKTEGELRYLKIASHDFLSKALTRLYEEGVASVLVEGGTGILKAFIETGLWDEARIGVSPIDMEEGVGAPDWPGKISHRLKSVEDEWVFIMKE